MNLHHSRSTLAHDRSGFTWGTTVPAIAGTTAEPSKSGEVHHQTIVLRDRGQVLTDQDVQMPVPERSSLLTRLIARWATLTRRRSKLPAEEPSAHEPEVASVSKSLRSGPLLAPCTLPQVSPPLSRSHEIEVAGDPRRPLRGTLQDPSALSRQACGRAARGTPNGEST